MSEKDFRDRELLGCVHTLRADARHQRDQAQYLEEKLLLDQLLNSLHNYEQLYMRRKRAH